MGKKGIVSKRYSRAIRLFGGSIFLLALIIFSALPAQAQTIIDQTAPALDQDDFQNLFEAGRGRFTEDQNLPVNAQGSPLETKYIALVMNEQDQSHILGPYFYVVPDPNNKYGVEDVIRQARDFSLNRRNTRDIVNLGYHGTPTWLVFRALNNHTSQNWMMGFGNTFEGRYGFANSVQVYTYPVQANQNNTVDFEKIRAANFTKTGHFALNLQSERETLVLVSIRPLEGVPLTLNPVLVTQTFLLEQNAPVLTPLSWLMIFVSGMVFFCLSLSLSKRSTMYLPFAAYYILLGMILLWNNANITGIGHFQGNVLPFLTGLLAICSLGLTKIFLNIKQYDYTERYFINGLGLVIFGCAMIALIPVPMPPVIRTILFYGPTILTFIGLPLLCFAQAQGGKNEAAPLIWAWLFVLAGLIISGSALSGNLTLTDITLNGFWIMLAPQAVFFIFAMLKKINLEEDQMFEEKAQANKETLSLVRLRHTKESAEQARLLKVIEKERQLLAQLREREAKRTEEMRKAKDVADEANRAKSAFLAVVSHEVRTPMTGIMGMVRLLLDSQINKQQKEYIQTIQESGDAMLTLLNDILDFEKIERGRMEIEQISFDLSRMIQGISTLMSGHAALKNITLETQIDENVPSFVIGDPNRLRQILLNLTGNAIKFTSEGSVRIRVSAEKTDGGLYNIRFAVKDSGIGISPEGMKNLFTPFAQANTSITRKYGGTGLGLAICKGLIQAMGSEIKVSSKEDQGSVFHFTLKMLSGDQEAQIPEILKPDLTLEDDTPEPEEVQKIDSAETSTEEDHALDPVRRIEELEKTPRILVVDDNEVNIRVILGFLEKIDCETSSMLDAQTLIEQLSEATQAPYDLILMDIQLPKLKGDEAARKIRKMEDPVIAGTPIIALSANTSEEDQLSYFEAGITAFVPKPIDPDTLLTKIADVLMGIVDKQKTVQTSQTGTEEKVPANRNLTDPPLETFDNLDTIFDTQTLGTLKDNLGKEQLDELLAGLLDKTHEIISALIEAQEKQDKEAMNARAHELKGMAGNFGLVEMTEMSMQAERLLKGQEEGDIVSHIMSFPAAAQRAETALRQWMSS